MVDPSRTVSYGTGPTRVYDVRLPQGGGPIRGTVVVVHGGFWREVTDRAHAAEQAQAFADDGYAVAVIEYSRTGMPGGGWPGTADDVRAAVRAIAADEELPAPRIAVGHSAGGHLVGLLACGDEAGGALAGVVSLGGCVDLTLTARMHLGDGAAQAFMGGGPDDVPDRYAAADPALRLPPTVPVHLVHGADDDVVPVEISRSYVRAAEAVGTSVPLTVIPGGDHFGVIDPDHPDFGVVLAVVREMTSTGTPASAP